MARMSTLHLERLLAPGSIAVFGASAREGSPGLALVRNLVEGGFAGDLHLVNPRYDEVLGRPCVRSLKAVDGVPDLALVLTPARLLNRTLVQCAERGTKLVIVMSGAPDPAKLHDYARRLGLRILGPWCAGLIRPHLKLHATLATNRIEPGSLAVVSQSASLAAALVDWAEASGVGFSALVSTGAGSDIRLPDLLDLLAEDYRTRAIIVYLDRVRGSRAFLSALAAAARSKPVILMKSTQDGAPHCNALTRSGRVLSSDAVFHAALARAGVVRIRTFSNLFSAAKILSSGLRTKGRRLMVVSNGAAPAMLACEHLETRGFRSPRLDAPALAALGEALDAVASRRERGRWSGTNPVVLRDPPNLVDQVGAAVAALGGAGGTAASDGFDALLVIFVPDARNDPALVARALVGAKPKRLPLLACWMGDASVGPARRGADRRRRAELPHARGRRRGLRLPAPPPRQPGAAGAAAEPDVAPDARGPAGGARRRERRARRGPARARPPRARAPSPRRSTCTCCPRGSRRPPTRPWPPRTSSAGRSRPSSSRRTSNGRRRCGPPRSASRTRRRSGTRSPRRATRWPGAAPTRASTACWSSRCTRRARSASSRSASAATRASGP